MTNLENSPARILLQLLLDQELLVDPGETGWVGYIGSMPDTENDSDNAACLYDTAPMLDGRIMRTGEIIQHPGIACRVRGLDYDETYKKAECLFKYLATVKRQKVFFEDYTYVIQCCSFTTGIVSLGESEVRSRRSFTFNMTMTLSRI